MNLRPSPITQDIEEVTSWCRDLYEFLKYPAFEVIRFVPRTDAPITSGGNMWYSESDSMLYFRDNTGWAATYDAIALGWRHASDETKIDGGDIYVNSVTANAIAANTITANEIAGNTITAQQIKGNTITASEIAANTITASEIYANTITANEIAALTITAAQIAALTITSAEIAAGTITASQINGGAFGTLNITSGKISIQTTDALEITSAGNIKVLAGSDIQMIGDDSSPAEIQFIGTSNNQWKMYADTAGNALSLENEISGLFPNFTITGHYDADERAELSVTGAPAGLSSVVIRAESGGTTRLFTFNYANLVPNTSGSVNLGGVSNQWANIFGGNVYATNTLRSNALTEYTTNSGVTIETVLIKDGIVDGTDVSLFSNLVTAEIQQLENIGATTISATQWGYLGALNQGLATTGTPQFATLTTPTISDPASSGITVDGVLLKDYNITLPTSGAASYGSGRLLIQESTDLVGATLSAGGGSDLWDLIVIISSGADRFAIRDSTTNVERFVVTEAGLFGFNTSAPGATLDSVGTYSDTCGGTNFPLYIDNTGIIGADPSCREAKKDFESLKRAEWIYDFPLYTYERREIERLEKKPGDIKNKVKFLEEGVGFREAGVIADEVAEIKPEIVVFDLYDNSPKSVVKEKLIIPILAELKQLRKEVTELREQ